MHTKNGTRWVPFSGVSKSTLIACLDNGYVVQATREEYVAPRQIVFKLSLMLLQLREQLSFLLLSAGECADTLPLSSLPWLYL